MKHNWQLIIDESFLNNKPLESMIESVYQQGKADAIDEIKEKLECWCWKHQHINQDELNELLEFGEK